MRLSEFGSQSPRHWVFRSDFQAICFWTLGGKHCTLPYILRDERAGRCIKDLMGCRKHIHSWPIHTAIRSLSNVEKRVYIYSRSCLDCPVDMPGCATGGLPQLNVCICARCIRQNVHTFTLVFPCWRLRSLHVIFERAPDLITTHTMLWDALRTFAVCITDLKKADPLVFGEVNRR